MAGWIFSSRSAVFGSEISQFNRVISQILPTVQLLYDAAIAADLGAVADWPEVRASL